ncbi:hypothetical protein [Longitalea arenae]|uniref:hypothetical protein n=1 Tax=Longitalea arenae TaxID=2812558 RepID=UPI0019688791|nr:hypothetical protein [Longitalea arenae]
MKKMTLITAALFATIIAANAQSSAQASQTVTLNLQNSIDIAFTAATGTDFTFTNTGDYQNGLTNLNASSLQVKSNRPWAVTVGSASANFNGPAAPSPAMPSSVLGVRLNGGSSFGALSTSAQSLTSGDRGVSSFSVDYNANPGFSYDAGTYTLSVIYTATQQ